MRVFDWVTQQSFDEMKKRSKKNVTFDDLMRTPDQFRGKLVQIDLNVRQVIRYDENPLDSKDLYELRGFTADSRAWLYCVITPELPDGVPVGHERGGESPRGRVFFQAARAISPAAPNRKMPR